jgi:RHS repeat-associated protein
VERLTAISAGSGGGVQLDGYAWDTVGNLSERVDYNNYVTETFGYDALNRMTAANISGGVAKSYAYDATGNLTSKSDVGTYSYPAAGSARPHGVTAITGSVDNGTGASGVISNPTYSYDANGNLTSGGGRSLTYSSFNVPTSITSGSSTLSFTFDSYHKRITQTAPEGTTVYLNGGGIQSEKYTNASTGVVTWRHYIAADGVIKAIYTQTGSTGAPQWGSVTWDAFNWTSSVASSTTYYLHQDHLGSVVAISSTSGAVIERDAYDPWGKRRNTTGADDTNDTMTGSYVTPGYTGQEELQDVALLHLNARLYDPQIGRFYGSDPLVSNPYSTQGWNRFAYVGNNPLLYTDPTGRAPICYYQPNFSTNYFDPIDGEVLELSETQVCIDIGDDLIPPNISIPNITTPSPSQDAQQKQEIVVYGQKKTLPAYDPLSQAITDIAYNLFSGPGGGQSAPQSSQDDPCGGASGDSGSSDIQAPPPPPSAPPPSLGDCLQSCAADYYGLGSLSLRGGIAALSTPFPKSLIGAPTVLGASGYTNALSAFAFSTGLDVNMGVRILGTTSAMRFAGRAVPYVGEALLAYDAVAIGRRTAACMRKGH